MASSLSSVPPVWPRPRPEIIGTKPPHAAASGASISETLSPTPPVECLSTTGPAAVARPVEHGAGFHHGARQRDPLRIVHAAEEHRHGERGGLPFGDRAVGQPFDEMLDLGIAQRRRRRASCG
jgi:hypothetical protein